MRSCIQRFKDRFYREYLWYTALETDLLFFVVCDVLFLTQVKGMSKESFSLLTFLSLAFSLVIQYPLLRFINRVGNKTAVRTGSVVFALSAICITFAPGFITVLIGGFLKCIGHTLNAMGTAILKNRLTTERQEDRFVSYQSDANAATSLIMMLTSLLCLPLFTLNEYLPMVACIVLSLVGIVFAFLISRDDDSAQEINLAPNLRQSAKRQKNVWNSLNILLFASFAIFCALTGTGLSYAKLNFQQYLINQDPEYIMMLLSVITTVVYLIRIVSNMAMRKAYGKVKNRVAIFVSILLAAGLVMQTLPWFSFTGDMIAFLCIGYLLMAFVRDPYITLIRHISLEDDDKARQQTMLITLNGTQKAGSLILSAVATLMLNHWDVLSVMILMTALAVVTIVLCVLMVRKYQQTP